MNQVVTPADASTPEPHRRGRHPLAERIPATRRFAYRTRYLINAYPTLYMPMARIRHRHSDGYCVSRETDIVIEGFGRAGNTFAWLAFTSAQPTPIRVAHHTHAAAQVITAVNLGVPTLVLVRPPLDAALSHMARNDVTARMALVAWTRFHRSILPHANGFVVSSFAEVTTDFGTTIERVNRRFGTEFGVFQHTKENELSVFDQIKARNRRRFGEHATRDGGKAPGLPTPELETRKQMFRAELESEQLVDLRSRAQRIFDALVPAAGASA